MATTEIQITRSESEPGSALLAVSVPPDHVQAAETKAAETIARRAKLPGFRPGRVPLHVVRKQYREAIRETVLRDLVRESWEAALERERLTPLGEPHIHNLRFEAGAPVTFEIHVDVKPELRLNRLGGFKLVRRVPPVTDETVDAQLLRLREQRAPWVPLSEERPKAGDLAHVSLAPFEGDSPREPQPFQFVLGEGRAVPEVEEGIMGLRAGETADIEIRYPDDHAEEAKRGLLRRVRIVLHEAKRQAVPDLTDEFAAEVGDFETLGELRRAVREDLEADAVREADARVRGELVDQIAQANGVAPPRPLVERALLGLAQAYGVSEEQWERFRDELHPVAVAQVRRELILDAVAEAEELRATEAELDSRITELAERRGVPARELYTRLEKENRLRDLERGMTEEKVFAHLLSLSTIDRE